MRILQVNPYHYPFMGGIEHRVHHMSRRLARRHEVTVLTSRLPGTEPEEEIEGYNVVRLDSKFIDIYNPPYVRSKGVLAAIKALSPDIVDFHYRWAPSYTRQVLRHRGPKVFTYHNTFGEGEGAMRAVSYLNDWSFTRKLRSFDRVVCISEFVRTDNTRHGIPLERMTVVPNGVEMPETATRDGDFILSLGRMVHTKGLEHLIRAMSNVEGRLVMAGSGPERGKMESLAAKLGLSDRVSFPGRVSEEIKAELFSSCSLFVMPSTFESYGIAAAEAMSYGKAVVATKVGGLPEVVSDCGVLVPPKDADSLASAIRSLLEDDAARKRLGHKARERAMRYSWDVVAADLERTYDGVLQG